MPDFPVSGAILPNSVICTFDGRHTPLGDYLLGAHFICSSTGAWPAASRAFAVGMTIQQTVTIQRMAWYNGATLSGNVDVGIYDTNYNRVVSVGGVAQAGASGLQVATVTTTTLPPGDYFFAQVLDNVTGLVFHNANASTGFAGGLYSSQMSTAYPLPATYTPSNPASAMMPYIMALANGTVI